MHAATHQMWTAAQRAALFVDGQERALTLVALEEWGHALGAALPRPAVVTLAGDLGTGKTTLTKAICAGIGVRDPHAVTSPTYALLHHYEAPEGPVIHADLYRLRSDRELETLGWDELVATAPVLIVEWPERANTTLPDHTIVISLAHDATDPARRLVRASLRG